MVAKFSVFGSCASRDIFYSKINKDYKKYFSIGEDGIRISIISLMQNPIHYDEQDLDLSLDIQSNIHKLKWIKKDLNKTFLEILKDNKFEYLIMDNYYDVNFGVLEFRDTDGQKNYITNNPGLTETSFYNKLLDKRFLTVHSDTNNYLNFWKKNCDLFFDFINENCPNLQIILNPVRDVYNVLTKEGNIIESDSFKRVAMSNNKFRIIFDKYICSNFNVDVLHFNHNTLADENHLWGSYSFHYYPLYFKDVTNQLIDIVNRNKIESQKECDRIKSLRRNNALLNFDVEYQKYGDFIE